MVFPIGIEAVLAAKRAIEVDVKEERCVQRVGHSRTLSVWDWSESVVFGRELRGFKVLKGLVKSVGFLMEIRLAVSCIIGDSLVFEFLLQAFVYFTLRSIEGVYH